MKEMKKGFLALLAAFMLTGIATGCSNETEEEETETEETETEETEMEEETEE